MAYKQQALRELALFAGAGGGILGGKLLGWETVCAVEWEPYPAAVLAARQNEGFLPPFPIWDDVQTFDGRPWRGLVDVVSGGFPCQDISSAGKGAGITGERSGMWKHMARIIGEVRPRYAFVENSPVLTSRGLGKVLGDLAAMGYDAEWGVLGAVHAGAPHERERIWIVAHSNGARLEEHGELLTTVPERPSAPTPDQEPEEAGRYSPDVAYAKSRNSGEPGEREGRENTGGGGEDCGGLEGAREICGEEWWSTEPGVGRVADGVAARVDRLSALGNGQVPQVAALAWSVLHERLMNR
ncbi:MAG: DNA cytosine methyltransferase [Alphaproteobacteria bacterium]